jgi:hypothetical protein
VNKALTIGMAGLALAATVSFAAVGAHELEPVAAASALPACDILTTIRAMGLDPIGDPVRRGPYYVLHAYAPSGVEMRVVADAQFGDILSAAPARVLDTAFMPRYEHAPRIIHVPQADERAVPMPLPRPRAAPAKP